jgi:hypothetical protein
MVVVVVVVVGASSSCAPSPACASKHSLQYTLPGGRATDLVQPSSLQRLPPPCEMQWCVPPPTAALAQPSVWQRLPPPCPTQWNVRP